MQAPSTKHFKLLSVFLFFAFVSCEKDEYWKTEQLTGDSQEKRDVASTGNTYVFNPKGTPPNSAEPCN